MPEREIIALAASIENNWAAPDSAAQAVAQSVGVAVAAGSRSMMLLISGSTGARGSAADGRPWPDQAARPGMMVPRLAPRRDDVSVRVAGRTGHLIIGGAAHDDVNQLPGGAG